MVQYPPISLEAFIQIVEKNTARKYVKECLYLIRRYPEAFNAGITMPYADTYSLYTLRLRIAKEKNATSEFIHDFEQLIEEMGLLQAEKMGISWIDLMRSADGVIFSYMIFYEPDSEHVLGILTRTTTQNASE